MSANQVAVTIDDISEANAPAIYVKDGLKPFLQAVKEKVSSEVPDLTTAKGRARIASLAKTVSDSKVAVEKPGREYLRRLKEMPKVVEVELKGFVDAMNALRDETRKPLTDWETAEQARKDRQVDAVQAIADFALDMTDINAAALLESIASVEAVQMGDHWDEFETDAARTKESTLTKLRAALAARQQYESEQAELVRLRAETEAQAQRDRDAEIARAAVEKAQREADEAAQVEREAAARREQALIDQAAEAERALKRAELDRIAAEEKSTRELAEAQLRQADAVERARLDEVSRQEAAADEILRQERLREADKEHKKTICLAAQKALMAGGIDEVVAKAVIILIHQRKVPAVSIAY